MPRVYYVASPDLGFSGVRFGAGAPGTRFGRRTGRWRTGRPNPLYGRQAIPGRPLISLYVVVDEPRGLTCFLRLDGPFRYPVWQSDAGRATPMTLAQACAYANAYGTRVDGDLRARVAPVAGGSIRDDRAALERIERAQASRAQQTQLMELSKIAEGWT